MPLHSWNQITGETDLYGEGRNKTQKLKGVNLEKTRADDLNPFAKCQCLIHSRRNYPSEMAPGISKDIQLPRVSGERSELS